ncbi:MAG: 50S ribosomal protein L5 [Planctomycetota bacterium]|nr:50S ribosomal protein L5 [Planctomycetota bacterium]
MARLRDHYMNEIRPALKEQLGLGNDFAVPRIQKITVSCGVGGAKDNKKLLENAVGILERVTGQKAVTTRARKSIAQFRLRQGMLVGARVTLRGAQMYEFLDRLINVVTPRIRDFRGLKRKLDGQGNYNMGLAEQSVFPEVDGELLETPQGMNIAMTIRSQSDDHSIALLEAFKFPFRREEVASVG